MRFVARLLPYRPHPPLAVQLADARRDLLTAERERTAVLRDLDDYRVYFLRASRRAEATATERDRLRDELGQALGHNEELAGRVRYLEGECRDLERSRENLTEIADGLRNELLALKARRAKR